MNAMLVETAAAPQPPAGPVGSLASRLRASVRARPAAWGTLLNFAFTSLAGTAVAVAGSHSLGTSLIFSYCIGFSIQACIHAGYVLVPVRVPRPLVVAAAAALGIALGLVLGGTLAIGEPLHVVDGDYSTAILALLFGALGVAGFALHRHLWAARMQIEQAKQDALARDKALAEADIRVLQAQMEPHFLFNTLSNIISLIHTDPERAARLLERLTAVLRASLSRARTTETTLGEEMDLVRAYLEIQALRMDGRMTWDVRVEPGIKSVRLPPLLVQPLVENAVLHGVEPAAGRGRVEVRAERSNGSVRLRVADDGAGLGSSSAGGAGECVANVRERLHALFGGQARLALRELPEGGVCAEMTFPAGGG